MKAIQLDAYGGPEVLQLRNVIDPVAGAGELVVDIYAASVNPVDWKIRNGARKDNLELNFPYTPGIDFSGVVRAAADVTEFGAGDEVFGVTPQTQQGTYADAIAVDASLVARVSPQVSPMWIPRPWLLSGRRLSYRWIGSASHQVKRS